MHALGRGLDSLIAGGSPEAAEVGSRILAITKIRPNPNQPRKTFDSAHLEDLRDSIRLHGVLQPICVRQIDGGYEIVSGERRWRASRLAALAEIPVVILEGVDDNRLLELAMVENLQRQDLDPMEKARGFEELMQQVGMTQAQVAERVGLKRSTVANHLRLLDLGEEAQDALISGLISMGHARALAGLSDGAELQKALAAVVRGELSVRQTEQLVREPEASSPRSTEDKSPSAPVQAPWAKDFERRIREAVGVQVELKNGKGYKGQVTLKYADRDKLEAIVELLAPKGRLD